MSKSLIISTGDISDVDGFMALAEYAKTGADVVFIMNYPAYLREDMRIDDGEFEANHTGLGFKYKASFEFEKEDCFNQENYRNFIKMRSEGNSFDRMKCAMTDLAFQFARRVWREVESECVHSMKPGRLFFYIGGENTINPFSKTAIKDEVLLYSEFLETHSGQPSDNQANQFCFLKPIEGMMYDEQGILSRKALGDTTGEGESFCFSSYKSVRVDFNGSMAFFSDDAWLVRELQQPNNVGKLAAVFIMGGVLADAAPLTMPCIKGTLNRFSCATMNQLYHPPHTARFLDFVSRHRIPAFIVTNNAVQDLTTWADDTRQRKSYQGIESFLHANGLAGPFLARLARAYYESPHNPPRKPFDYYTAAALRAHLEGAELDGEAARLFYSGGKGVALVGGPAAAWEEARDAYRRAIDQPPAEGDSDFLRAKKASFARERQELAALPALPFVEVQRAGFKLCGESHRLEVKLVGLPPSADGEVGGEHGSGDDGAETSFIGAWLRWCVVA